MIVTVTPTIMDGTVVRWYGSESAAEYGAEMLSVSCDGVKVNVYLHKVPDDVLALANHVYLSLKRGRRADVQHLATHRRRGMFGPLEPIATAEATDGQ